MTSFFKIKECNKDYPYYRNNPPIHNAEWVVLLLSIPLSYLCFGLVGEYSEILGSIIFCFGMVLPLLYYSDWNYRLIFDKVTKEELKLAILMCIGYLIYSTIISVILESYGFFTISTSVVSCISIESLVSPIFSVMAEELLKFIPLMFLMRLFYKYTQDRKTSLILSAAIVLTLFGLLHYSSTNQLIVVLLLQGLGSSFELYAYIKSKNLFVPYMSHLFTDMVMLFLLYLF